jgi:hypothetical protein
MKVRIGFVSNSSSSSFVCAIKADSFNEKLKELNKLDQKILNHLFQKDSAFGQDVRTFSEYDSHGYGSWEWAMDDFDWDDEEEDDKDGRAYTLVHNFIDKFEKNDYFAATVDF